MTTRFVFGRSDHRTGGEVMVIDRSTIPLEMLGEPDDTECPHGIPTGMGIECWECRYEELNKDHIALEDDYTALEQRFNALSTKFSALVEENATLRKQVHNTKVLTTNKKCDNIQNKGD